MAIEFNIHGDFDLDGDVAALLRGAIGPECRIVPPDGEDAVFQLRDEALIAVGLPGPYRPAPEFGFPVTSRSAVYFRVLSTPRLMEATAAVLRCAAALLRDTAGNLRLDLNGDLPLLARVAGSTRAFLHGVEPESEFWRSENRMALLPGPVSLEPLPARKTRRKGKR